MVYDRYKHNFYFPKVKISMYISEGLSNRNIPIIVRLLQNDWYNNNLFFVLHECIHRLIDLLHYLLRIGNIKN